MIKLKKNKKFAILKNNMYLCFVKQIKIRFIMESIKEKYIIGICLAVLGYLMWRVNDFFIDDIFDHVLINFLIFSMWYITFSHRDFVMTRKRLGRYLDSNLLEYKALMVDGLIKDIYVRVKNFNDWYKLDYLLTISNHCEYSEYESFVSKNRTVGDLLRSMNSEFDDLSVNGQYRMMKSNYIVFKYLSLIFFITFEFFYWIIYNNILVSNINEIIY